MNTRTPITTPAATVQQLRIAVENMDALAHEGFSQITAIAKLALTALETPDGWQHPETIAQALTAIQGKAEVQNDCITSEALDVGIAHVDSARQRRFKAMEARAKLAG